MKLAIIGSRGIDNVDLSVYVNESVTEIVSGGAKGIDTAAKEYAIANNIKLTEFLPDYQHYGRGAPLRRNIRIIEYSDKVIAFWDGKSKGTEFVIKECKKCEKDITVIRC